MKINGKNLKLSFLLWVFVTLCLGTQGIGQSGKLTIELKNIESEKGNIMLALFQKADGFPFQHQQAYKIEKVPAKRGVLSISFDNMPLGKYAVAVYHDANADAKLNTNTLGIPKEGYAFSNNVRPVFSAPKFSDAAFDFEGSKKIELVVKY